MQLFGISIPTFAVAIGTIITAFIAGFGMGMGSELGKYIVEKYWKPRLAKIHKKLDKHIITPFVERTKTKPKSLILAKAFNKKKKIDFKNLGLVYDDNPEFKKSSKYYVKDRTGKRKPLKSPSGR